ncbi:MAG: Xaa-Pro peptidase family protein [Spirochaetaceae bacterium]|nr:Xaa-Pro peptidase family protein [Spirochaetaceae bacterium]
MTVYESRRQRLYDWMAQENIALAMFEDTESRRDPAVRWLCGMPADALLFLSVDRHSILIPWDTNMAARMGQADILMPYNDFDRQAEKAIRGTLDYLKIPLSSKVEIPPVTPYLSFLRYVELFSDFDVICRKNGIHQEVVHLRSVKDMEEIARYRKIATLTNEIIDLLEEQVRAGSLTTELEVALFIEAESRKRGCEGLGFETLAAGPARSFGIHAFPPYTAGAFASAGLSILDFGLRYEGYTSDVTMTFARGTLSKTQENMLILVQQAHDFALDMVASGEHCRSIGLAVEAFFSKSKKVMPHNLGHGIGLEAHEAPSLRSGDDNDWVLKPGMVFTIEPGLYDNQAGGCRLEDDILLTEAGAEVLTKSRIVLL